MRVLSSLIILFAMTTGCAKHSAPYEQATATGTAAEAESLLNEGMELWAGRDDAASLKGALDKFEAAYTADPTNREAAVLLTRGWYF